MLIEGSSFGLNCKENLLKRSGSSLKRERILKLADFLCSSSCFQMSDFVTVMLFSEDKVRADLPGVVWLKQSMERVLLKVLKVAAIAF